MKRGIVLFSFLLLLRLCLVSQPAFEVNISHETNDYSGKIMEDSIGQYIIAGFSGDYWQPQSYKSYIYRINQWGDTIGKYYSKQDTIFIFDKISKVNDNRYLVFGSCANAPAYDKSFMTMILNKNLDIISYKRFQFDGYNDFKGVDILKSSSSFYACAILRNKQLNHQRSLLVEVDFVGDTIQSKILEDFGGAQSPCDIELSSNGKLWLFGTGFNSSSGGSRLIFDTSFNFIRSHFLPEFEGLNMDVKWITDSTLLFGAKYLHYGSNPQDDDIGISETDTSFLNLDINYFGSIDTIDYPAWENIIDFNHPDSIYFAGTHNLIIDFWPEWPSWIMFGQLNRELEKRFEYFYGGDAYYETLDIIATSDGGCLISALKYDYTTQDQEYDIVILKYNLEDLITSIPNIPIFESNKICAYPNPGKNHMYMQANTTNSQLLLYNIEGKLVLHRNLIYGLNTISTIALQPGIYVYRIISNGQIIQHEKWIKQ